MIANIVGLTEAGKCEMDLAMLFSTMYVFLLRLPSESLPIIIRKTDATCAQATKECSAVLALCGNELVLHSFVETKE